MYTHVYVWKYVCRVNFVRGETSRDAVGLRLMSRSQTLGRPTKDTKQVKTKFSDSVSLRRILQIKYFCKNRELMTKIT